MKVRLATLSITFLVLAACAGSTSFLDRTNPTMTLSPGVGDSITMEFEAEGSHAGEYAFSATVTRGQGLSATVEPGSADVDGVIELVVTITAADTAPTGAGAVLVEGISTRNESNAAGTTVFVEVAE